MTRFQERRIFLNATYGENPVVAMIDSGASFDTISRQFAIHNNIPLEKITSFAADNVDETLLRGNKN